MAVQKRLFAWAYHNLMTNRGKPDLTDSFTRSIRKPLIEKARGDVLEIGAGNGGNLSLYPDGVILTLLDPNPYMIHYLEQACTTTDGIVCASVVEGHGERLPFPDQHFDTVVTTHVLCSVTSQRRVLAEVLRVLRPGGQFLFLEHVTAEPGAAGYRTQRAINPVWKFMGDGCNLTRDTGKSIQRAGFSSVDLTAFDAQSFPTLVKPHIVGIASV